MQVISNWLQVRPPTVIGFERAYVDLPAFTYAVSWAGASEIICQYNFAASNNFVLSARPTKPAGVNYCLCIRYRVGNTVTRFKLWDGVGEIIPHVSLYNPLADIIKKNFVLEVWNAAGQSSVDQATALRLFTSLRRVPSDESALADYELSSSVLVYPLTQAASTTIKTLPATLPASLRRYVAEDFDVDTQVWADSSGNARDLTRVGIVAEYPTEDFGGIMAPYVKYPRGIGYGANGTGITNVNHVFVFFNTPDLTSLSEIFTLRDVATAPVTAGIYLYQNSSDLVYYMNGNPVSVAGVIDGNPLVAHLGLTGVDVYRHGSLVGHTDNNMVTQARDQIRVGNNDLGDGYVGVREVLIYNTLTDSEIASIIEYLSYPYYDLPLTFNSLAAGGDNDA